MAEIKRGDPAGERRGATAYAWGSAGQHQFASEGAWRMSVMPDSEGRYDWNSHVEDFRRDYGGGDQKSQSGNVRTEYRGRVAAEASARRTSQRQSTRDMLRNGRI